MPPVEGGYQMNTIAATLQSKRLEKMVRVLDDNQDPALRRVHHELLALHERVCALEEKVVKP